MCFFVRFAPARAPRPFLSVFFQQSIKPTCVLPCGVSSPWGVLTRFFGTLTTACHMKAVLGAVAPGTDEMGALTLKTEELGRTEILRQLSGPFWRQNGDFPAKSEKSVLDPTKPPR